MNLASIILREGDLPATRTYRRRWWKWFELPGLPCDGVMLLGQVSVKGEVIDEQTYGVEEVRSRHFGMRSFCVRKLGATVGAEDEQYTTTIGHRNSICTCVAGRTRTEVCRHRDGLAALIAAGVLPAKELIGA
jgi:hypothetical protein